MGRVKQVLNEVKSTDEGGVKEEARGLEFK